MPNTHPRGIQTLIIACAIFAAALVLSGCGESSSDASTPTTIEPTVDPRFASAEAITAHFNELVQSGPQRVEHVLAMMYPENKYQQRVIATLRKAVPFTIFMLEVEDHFGEPLMPDSPINDQTPQLDEAVRLVKTEPSRAEGVYTDERGEEGRFYFIKVENRWWISGYTLEYASEERINPFSLDLIDEMTELMAASTSEIRGRLQSGSYQNIQQVRRDFIDMVQLRLDEHPNRFQMLRGMMPSRQ